MLAVDVRPDEIRIGSRLSVSFQRTLRLPEQAPGGNEADYPLPPTFGRFPVHRVADYADRVPADWVARGGVFIPMHRHEAMWLAFGGPDRRPTAVQVGAGGVNVLTGDPFDDTSDGPLRGP